MNWAAYFPISFLSNRKLTSTVTCYYKENIQIFQWHTFSTKWATTVKLIQGVAGHHTHGIVICCLLSWGNFTVNNLHMDNKSYSYHKTLNESCCSCCPWESHVLRHSTSCWGSEHSSECPSSITYWWDYSKCIETLYVMTISPAKTKTFAQT